MAISVLNVPPNAVEMLFAEDLINHLLYRHNGTHYETWRSEPFRHLISNVFNDDVRKAVDFIDMSLEWEIDEEFSKLVDDFEVNEKSFIDYALHHEQFYFSKGFVADCFLHYCVRLVGMAGYFAQHNVPSAPDLSLYFILKVLEGRDMLTGGWDTVNVIAKKYAKIKNDFHDVLTPEVSDDESVVYNSDDSLDMNGENQICDHDLNRHYLDELQTPESKFETGDRAAAREDLVQETMKLVSNTDSSVGHILEEKSSYELLPDAQENFDVAYMSNGKSNLMIAKLIDINEDIPHETVEKKNLIVNLN